MNHISLKNLQKNIVAIVIRITASNDFSCRIRSMGIFPGASVEVMNRPFFNDSLMVKVDGCILVMKKTEAACITVEPLAQKSS